ncbi:fimbrial protein [Acinetobacter nematophilus]|uniref:Fimbrial protein n=1 Tax=Acinetobacter nematophilus TaxID=2994642 RepID=A0A9X3DQV9_9GAMM|nr:fimbrial protein [Acinetobacter nematophilus]MCX5466366.1 fimbrial protein [Acinetobacter nematophilus]
MNKLLWLSAPFIFMCSQSVFATCSSRPAQAIYSNSSNTITNFSYSQSFPSAAFKQMIGGCNPTVKANAIFNASSGNTDLTGSSPFGVASSITISGSTADAATLTLAKAWLVNNLKITFNMYDNSNNGSKAKNITALNTNYNILPDTATGQIVNFAGEQFYNGSGSGTPSVDTRITIQNMSLVNTTKPSAEIINALNGATIRIRLGTYSYKYADYNASSSTAITSGSLQMYEDMTLNFSFPTCTMANQTVTLAPVPTGILNSNQAANEQPFNVTINCTAAMPNKVLLATITDSYTPSNVNNNGVLKNQPTLVNRSNVDVQLRDSTDTPLAIGTQSSFYAIPAGSSATIFTKGLKARYYRSAATATPGYVKTQATVSLDYQ